MGVVVAVVAVVVVQKKWWYGRFRRFAIGFAVSFCVAVAADAFGVIWFQ